MDGITVMCPKCAQEFNEEEVEFIDVEEDLFGEDVETFVCPNCETEVKSLRRG
uniref:Small CPxCG-related zinc finger protein n=1 Tax=viral metagenome TaxID=1070528 RepID=A0A6M3II87_9ZZZZ